MCSEQVADKKNALDVIDIWRSRGRIPVAVDGTSNLVSIMLRDSYFHDNSECKCSDEELRGLYSIHIIRCVNSTVDLAQKGAVAMSVEGLAKSLGIASWIVELRHEGTHGPKLPSLSSLRLAAEQLLQYFFAKYWQVQADMLLDVPVDEVMNPDQVWQLLDLQTDPTREVDFKQIWKICMNISDDSSVIAWLLDRSDHTERFQLIVTTLIARLSDSFLPRLFNASTSQPALLRVIASASNPRVISSIALDCVHRNSGDAELFRTLKPYL